MRQAEQLGWGHAILCAERVVVDEPFAALRADDFLTQQTASAKSNVTNDLKNAFETNGQTQLSVMRAPGADISKYGVIVQGATSLRQIYLMCCETCPRVLAEKSSLLTRSTFTPSGAK